LRDFHADNLMWLPGREGNARVGLLDYQDALWGDAAYDMVSFLQDARRDVSAETVAMCMEHYLRHSKEDWHDFKRRYAILGAQRNTKIIGIFTRLCVRDGKAQYLHFLPRVWRLLAKDLNHPALEGIKLWMDQHIPPAMRETITIKPQAVA
jgi:aminoglycoside/choline kinase family phosphotransferase